MKFCSLCSPKWFHNDIGHYNVKPPSDEGLNCSICNMFACKNCLTSAIRLIEGSSKINSSTFIVSSRKWYEDVKEYLRNNNHPDDFVGHCCIIKTDIGTNQGISHTTEHKPSYGTKCHINKLGGSLFFPEYKVLIESPKNVIDVHALGKESSFPAVWHCVLPPYGEHTPPRNIRSSCVPLRKNIEIPCYYSYDIGKSSMKFDVCIYIVPRLTDLEVSRKGSNDVSQEEIAASCFVNDLSYLYSTNKSHYRVLMVIGNDGPLLLCRFLDQKCKMSTRDQSKLFDYLYNFLHHNATERMRFGGSSGNFDSATKSNIRRILTYRTNAPREPRGVIWLLSELKIDIVYLSPRSRVFVSHKYSLPVQGGNFSINEDQTHYLLRTYKDFANFMLRKIDTAYILEKLNNDMEIPIVPEAMNEELDRVGKARSEMLDCISTSNSKSIGIRKNILIQKYAKYVKFTIVVHPVGLHQDNFSHNKASYNGLENKVIFSHLKQVGVGRGGLGDNYAWGLLDW